MLDAFLTKVSFSAVRLCNFCERFDEVTTAATESIPSLLAKDKHFANAFTAIYALHIKILPQKIELLGKALSVS